MTSKRPSQSTYTRRRRKRRNAAITPLRVWTALAMVLTVAVLISWKNCEESHARDLDRINPASPADIAALMRVEVADRSLPQEIVPYHGFTVSFNRDLHIPNYVAWSISRQTLKGDTKRTSKFLTDPSVDGCPTLNDYRRSGFDRGHMAPAGDMKTSVESMTDSHRLTNICPQDHQLNDRAWRVVETSCRQWAERDSVLVIICGPVVTDVMPRRIGASGVAVPERFFKVVLAPAANPPRAIGFLMPNSIVDGGVETTVTSVDQIEAITGYDFFAALPDSIENIIEAQADYHRWTRSRR